MLELGSISLARTIATDQRCILDHIHPNHWHLCHLCQPSMWLWWVLDCQICSWNENHLGMRRVKLLG